jgi:hypothetical protein
MLAIYMCDEAAQPSAYKATQKPCAALLRYCDHTHTTSMSPRFSQTARALSCAGSHDTCTTTTCCAMTPDTCIHPVHYVHSATNYYCHHYNCYHCYYYYYNHLLLLSAARLQGRSLQQQQQYQQEQLVQGSCSVDQQACSAEG